MEEFNTTLKHYCEERLKEFYLIDEKRKTRLNEIAGYIKEKLDRKEKVKLNFICTHNSRRSHFGQIWAQTACYYFGIHGIETYSGGTEASAFNERSVAALIRAGFDVQRKDEGDAKNPWYNVKPGENFRDHFMFSKVYNDQRNPQENYAAIMVCSHADENCPVVFGAEQRFSLTYEDPKEFDGTDKESEMYDKRCAQIAREIFYIFKSLNQ